MSNKKITTMKKNLIWCFLAVITAGLLCISLVSCDKDDTFSTPVNASHLVGRWKFTNGGLEGKTIQFDSNGTYSASFTYLYAGYYTLSGNVLTLRSSRGNKYTLKIAIKDPGLSFAKMTMEGTSDSGQKISYTLEKN